MAAETNRRRKGEGLSVLLKPYPGYSKRAARALLTAFPDWQPYLQSVPSRYEPSETAFVLVVPDPVSGRGEDLSVTSAYGLDEILVSFCKYGSHAHLSRERTEDEADHFAFVCAFLTNFVNEKIVYWASFKNGASEGSGGYGEIEPVDAFIQRRYKPQSADAVRVFSWKGTLDREILLAPQSETKSHEP